jgi:glycosyltransferase involved in cell wall biosynthesis
VLERLARLVQAHFQPAGLLVMFDDGCAHKSTPTLNRWRDRGLIHASSINDWPGARRLRRWLLPAYPLAVRDLSTQLEILHAHAPIDLVISTSSCAIKSLRTPLARDSIVPHLCYCFAPARYLWSQREAYAAGFRGLALRLLGPPLRAWDRRTSRNVTRFVALSRHIQNEIESSFGRSSDLVHPPTRTEFFTPLPAEGARSGEELDRSLPGLPDHFWLLVGALEPYKRAELAIRAAALAGKPLLVVGEGSDLSRLRRLKAPTTSFLGRVSDEILRHLYRHADALLFPQIEDFGIVAVEALACGWRAGYRDAGC